MGGVPNVPGCDAQERGGRQEPQGNSPKTKMVSWMDGWMDGSQTCLVASLTSLVASQKYQVATLPDNVTDRVPNVTYLVA